MDFFISLGIVTVLGLPLNYYLFSNSDNTRYPTLRNHVFRYIIKKAETNGTVVSLMKDKDIS